MHRMFITEVSENLIARAKDESEIDGKSDTFLVVYYWSISVVE